MTSDEQQQTIIVGRIWQAIAQSGVDTTALSREELETMVNTIAEAMLAAFEELQNETTFAPLPPAATPPTSAESTQTDDPALAEQIGDEEVVLWEGKPFVGIGESYIITSERVRLNRGVLGRNVEDIELVKLQDIDYNQSMGDRLINIGDIVLRSADVSSPEVTLHRIRDPENVHSILRRAMLEARKRHRLTFREEM